MEPRLISTPSAAMMERYCDGDPAAFRALHACVAPRVFGFLITRTRDPGVAEDLLQLTFLKVHRARGAYVRGADPVPWICAIAHRTFLDHARAQRRARVNVTADGSMPEPLAEVTGTAHGAGAEPSDADERQPATLAALARLPAIYRDAVVWTKLEGKSVAAAAVIAGTTPGAMKVRVHRGYRALRKLLVPDDGCPRWSPSSAGPATLG